MCYKCNINGLQRRNMNIIIKQADNGFILETEHDELEDMHLNNTFVIEQDDRDTRDSMSNPFTLQKLVWELKDLLGEYGSKHDQYRFYAVVKDHNDKEVE